MLFATGFLRDAASVILFVLIYAKIWIFYKAKINIGNKKRAIVFAIALKKSN